MNFTIEHRDKIVIFTVKNHSIDNEISARFKAEMLIICQPDIDALIIDLSNVKVIDSSGLSALLLAHRQLKDYEIPAILVGVQGFVRTMMSITRIEGLYEFFDTMDDAIDSLEFEGE